MKCYLLGIAVWEEDPLKVGVGTGEMPQWLRILASLPEDPISILSTYSG